RATARRVSRDHRVSAGRGLVAKGNRIASAASHGRSHGTCAVEQLIVHTSLRTAQANGRARVGTGRRDASQRLRGGGDVDRQCGEGGIGGVTIAAYHHTVVGAGVGSGDIGDVETGAGRSSIAGTIAGGAVRQGLLPIIRSGDPGGRDIVAAVVVRASN